MSYTKRKEEEYYIVSAKCREMKYFDGTIATKEDEVVWLGLSDGYPACGAKGSASRFKSLKDATNLKVANWDGMPWWYRLKPGTLKIYHVSKVVVEDYREEEVKLDGTATS
jgi:hypothetical protein